MSVHTGRSVTEDRVVSCDVCVVGSGAGGAHVAARLAAAGHSVVVLEDGGFHRSRDFDMTEATMVPRLYQERGWRSTADGSIGILQGRAVGGTTVVNWTTCFRTPERVLKHWAEHHGVKDLDHASLVPHWERIEKRLSIESVAESDLNANNRVLWDGSKKLGYRTELLKRNVNNCAHTGYCGVGCPIDAKQSMLVTMIPEAVRHGAEVYANAWVERVDTSGRRATAVVARMRDPETDRPNGATLTVRPRTTVLSAGGINSPAILLRSGLDRDGRVGKRTFLHPAAIVVGVHDRRIAAFTGAPQYVGCHEFSERSEGMGFLMESSPLFPMLAAASNFELGLEHQQLMEQLPYMSATNAILADGFDLDDPEEGGTVTLRDDGHPQVHYKWSARLEEALREATRRQAEIHLTVGAREVFSMHARPVIMRSKDDLSALDDVPYGPGQIAVSSAHVMGGCGMGSDPRRSVVDAADLRHHDFDNLYVVDGSVFPTALGVNPQLSIYGVASWASDRIVSAA